MLGRGNGMHKQCSPFLLSTKKKKNVSEKCQLGGGGGGGEYSPVSIPVMSEKTCRCTLLRASDVMK